MSKFLKIPISPLMGSSILNYIKVILSNKVDIKFTEGLLNIEIDYNDNIFMTGPVSEIKNIKIEI